MFRKKQSTYKPARSIKESQVGDLVHTYAGANQEYEITAVVTRVLGDRRAILCVHADHPSWINGETKTIVGGSRSPWTIVEEKCTK